MTFVTCFARPHFISVCSDGRMMRDGEPIAEDVKKFLVPQEHCFIAFGGPKTEAEGIVGSLVGADFSDIPLLAGAMSAVLQEPRYCAQKIGLILGTCTPIGSSIAQLFSGQPEPCLGTATETEDLVFAFLSQSGSMTSEKLTAWVHHYLQTHNLDTPKQMQQAQVTLQQEVAGYDPTVNLTVFSAVIR